MEANEHTIKLYYNTEVEKLRMPEYGRIVLQMVEQMKEIPDRAKRSEQAGAIVKVMERLNPQVHQQENWNQKLWDHLYMIAGYDLDIDAPFPAPVISTADTILNENGRIELSINLDKEKKFTSISGSVSYLDSTDNRNSLLMLSGMELMRYHVRLAADTVSLRDSTATAAEL